MALVGLGGLPLRSALYSLGSMTLGTVLNGLDSYFRSAFNSWRLAARLGVDGYGGLLMGSVLNVPGSLPLGSALSGSLPLGMALGGLNRLPLGTARNDYGCSPLGMALRRLHLCSALDGPSN